MVTIAEMPWLLRPTEEARVELKSLTVSGGVADFARLRNVTNFAWNETDLGAIGRKIRKITDAIGHVENKELATEGLTGFRLFVISSNTASHLTDALRATALRAGLVLDCPVIEYGEPESWIASNAAAIEAKPLSAILLALDRKALHLQSPVGDEAGGDACVRNAVERVDSICEQLAAITKAPIIVQNLAPSAADPQSSMEGWLAGSPRSLVAEYNRALAAFARKKSVLLFDVETIADLVGHAPWNAGRYWYTAKLPFAPACIPLYCHRLVQLLAAMQGRSRRVLVLDLDNTLWGGVVGDDGVEGLVLGPGSAKGEAFLDMQRLALHYKERGIVLCISSKNSAEIALEAFRNHPEMLLKDSDIAVFRINWDDKATNIRAISKSLELGLETFVFLDDNPAERKLVRDTLPTVVVPELGDDPSTWLPTIHSAGYFEQTSFSSEDGARTEFYKANARRDERARNVTDYSKFLESLEMTMKVAPFDAVGRARIAQLISKSNQFNLTTRRYSESAVAAMECAPDVETLQIRLVDTFGDNGMISVLICRKSEPVWQIDTWIMSCRVLGRCVEQAVLNVLAARAGACGAVELEGRYVPTAKNEIVREHYAKLGFSKASEAQDGSTTWKLKLDQYEPKTVPIAVQETIAI